MKTFYGGHYIGKEELANNNIYHPIRLDYYKIEEKLDFDSIYGIEVIKTEYKDHKIEVEQKELNRVTYEESEIIKLLEIIKCGEVTPIVLEEIIQELVKV